MRRLPLPPYLSLTLLGALTALLQPPFFFWPALVVLPLAALVWAKLTTPKQAVLGAFIFSISSLVPTLYWIAASMLIEPEKFGWAIPFAVLGLPAFFSVYSAGLAYAFKRWGGKIAAPLQFALILILSELCRAWLFTGFSWVFVGSVWLDTPLSALYAWLGVYGVSVLTIITVVSFVYWRQLKLIPLLSCAVFLGLGILSYIVKPALPPDTAWQVVIVQPNVGQLQKRAVNERAALLDQLVGLSQDALANSPDSPHLLVWPEMATTYFIAEQPWLKQSLQNLLGPQDGLIFGAPRRDKTSVYNSLYAINQAGTLQHYDKAHLVPFGEYVPFAQLLRIESIAAGKGFTAGPGPAILPLGGLSFQPLICYEIIFPAQFLTTPRPDVLVNVTNDGWFGQTSGPYQHLAHTRLRAIEQGLPVIRAANTGISAVIDAQGNLRQTLSLGQMGVLTTLLPAPLPPTLYSKYPFAGLFFSLSFAGFLGYLTIRYKAGLQNQGLQSV